MITAGDDLTLLGGDAGGFVVKATFPLGFEARGVVVDELDGDGLPDVLAWSAATAFLPGSATSPEIDSAEWNFYQGVVAGEFSHSPGRELACLSRRQLGFAVQRQLEVRTLRPTQPWVGLGGSFGGDGQRPRLAARGGRLTGDAAHLWLSRGTPGTTAFLVLGASRLDAPFLGGTLVPTPTRILPVALDSAGSASLAFGWPAHLVGRPTCWQAWMPDATQPQGFRASNALEAFVP